MADTTLGTENIITNQSPYPHGAHITVEKIENE